MSEPTPLDCEKVLRVIFAYLDDELEERERQQVSNHLERCRACFSRAEFERRLKVHLAEVGSAPVPASLESRVRSILGQLPCD